VNLRIIREAEAELQDAIARYESIESGLGVRLKEEARATMQWISQNHDLPRIRPAGYQRVNFKVFPYYVAYAKWNEVIWVLAVAHVARRPEYWIRRSPGSG
jgi:hypothetical protein